MGNRHGGERTAKDEKEEKKRKKKEKKAKKKQRKKAGAAGSDLDLDPESSQFSRADSESLVFHSAENLSPYLDASTRSEEGAACGGFYDNGHILSSKDFHDGFSLEACLPADLAASALVCDVTGDADLAGDDVTSMASGVYGTPLLSSPDVRRGIPRSPLAQRQKDSFVEPVPPIPSDFSSNTLSSVSYQEGVSTPGTPRSSSRASSSTVDTNAAHCIERLEELERNIERTIIERFASLERVPTSSGNTTPQLARRAGYPAGERSREGSVTPKGTSSDGAPAQSPATSPAVARKVPDPCQAKAREGSATPIGFHPGGWSQSAENSPAIVRRALPSPESPIIVRRTPSQSPSVERKFPANAPESPVFYRRAVRAADSPALAPATQRQAPVDSSDRSPQLVRAEAPDVEPSGTSAAHKSKIPPPVPPKPVMKTLTSPEIARRLQNMPKSPIMPRKVYAFQEQSAREKSALPREDPWDRSRREHQMPPKSPSRSPEVRHRVTRKTPSSSPSPKSLGRKLMPQEDRAPPPVTSPPCPLTQVQFCQQERGIPVKHCIVATQPSAAVVLDIDPEDESVADSQTKTSAPPPPPADAKHPHPPSPTPPAKDEKTAAMSEDLIKKSTESAVFGSVSPKLKRHKKLLASADDSSHSSSLELQRGEDSTDSSTRSPPCSPHVQRGRPALATSSVQDGEGSDHSPVRPQADTSPDRSPAQRRARFLKQNSRCGEDGALSSDIAGGLTYHTHLLPEYLAPCPHPQPHERRREDFQHHPGNLQETDSAMVPVLYRRGVEEYDNLHQTGDNSSEASPATQQLSRSTPPTTEAREWDTAHSAVTTESTVGRNARELPGNTDTQHAADVTGREEARPACQRESVQRVPSPCQRVPSPPSSPQPAAACSASTKPVCRNLGQRIRDVIHESSFREVFTAELSSSSSVEREEGTYTSDDSVLAHGAPHPFHPRPHPHQPRPPLGRETRADSSPLSSPPTPHRAVQAKREGVTTQGHATPPPPGRIPTTGYPPPDFPHPYHSASPPHEQHVPLSPSLSGTAIRRIDIDVNVILPAGGSHEGVTVAMASQELPPGNAGEGQRSGEADGGAVTERGAVSDQQHTLRSSPADNNGGCGARANTEAHVTATEAGRGTASIPPGNTKTAALMETTQGADTPLPAPEENVGDCGKGDKPSQEICVRGAPPIPLLPTPTLGPPAADERLRGELNTDSAVSACFASENTSGSDTVASALHQRPANQVSGVTDSAQTCGPVSGSVSVQEHEPASSPPPLTTTSEQSKEPQALDVDLQDSDPVGTPPNGTHQPVKDILPSETVREHVPPPSPTAMDTLAEEVEEAEEEEEEEGEDVNCMIKAHQDSNISSKISEEMQLFGETVVRRLSSLLESQASESDSCLEESRTDLLSLASRHRKTGDAPSSRVSGPVDQAQTDALSGVDLPVDQPQTDALSSVDRPTDQPQTDAVSSVIRPVEQPQTDALSSVIRPVEQPQSDPMSGVDGDFVDSGESPQNTVAPLTDTAKEDVEPVLHEELNTFSAADLPGERLVTSDTTETLSTDHDTSASSKRESTASTATDETLTSFKTRSTTDSAEFEDAFVLPESLVFVRSVNEGAEGEGEGVVVESGKIIKRPPIPAELTRHHAAHEPTSQKPRKKRRRQVGAYDISARADVTEPEPKRGSKQIQEVIDAYCEEMSDESDISSSTDDILSNELVHPKTYSRGEHHPRQPASAHLGHKDIVRKPRPPADRSTDSSDESAELEAKRQSSSHDSSFRIPEIEETFGELMGVKTFLEDLEDKTPTSERPPGLADEEPVYAKEFVPSSHHQRHRRRRSKTSPAKTDRTESDLDVSEHRDDASTDSMYADDEDEGTELVFQRSYSEEHGGEVVLSCTIYNSSRDNDADSDDFWADADDAAAAAAAADESYKSLETAADAAGSAFQNARIQMHDIHQHLQDLRRQMELLQEDITSTSLTLTPEFSLESEQRPVTE